MIHIDPLPDAPLPDLIPRTRRPFPFGCIEALFFVVLTPLVGGLLGFWFIQLEVLGKLAFPIAFAVGAVCVIVTAKAAIRAVDRKFECDTEQQFAAALNQARDSARRHGYVALPEGGSHRHRVTISRIITIWSVDGLEDFGPGYILRTAESEHVYCAGQAFLDSEDEGYADGVFHLAETLTLELSDDLQYIEAVKCQGRRVPVMGDEVPIDVLPPLFYMVGFAILDDPNLIRRLPPVPDAGQP